MNELNDLDETTAQPADTPGTVFLLLIFGYSVMDFMIPAMFAHAGPSSMFPVFLAFGAILGQIAFLTIWAALGPFRLWVRWPAVLLTSVGLYSAFCLGILTVGGTPSSVLREMAAPAMFIPLLFLIVQFPLWIRRSLSGWRIVPNEEAAQSSATEARQFSLMHILALMAFLAIALSLARTAMTFLAPREVGAHQLHPRIWLGILAYFGIILLYIAVWAGPCLRACFFTREKGVGCVVIVVVWFGVSMLMIFVFAMISAIAGGGAMPGEVIPSLFGAFAGTVIVLMSSLHLLRVSGYTMIRTKRLNSFADHTSSDGPLDEGESPFADRPSQDPPANPPS